MEFKEIGAEMNPFFSIIVTVYNAENYLREFLDSLLSQSFSDWECVCVDDGSKDSSSAILDEYAERDKRLRIVHKENEGVGKARNIGLALATAKWISWADADDVLAPSRLETAHAILQREDPDMLQLWFVMGIEIPDGFYQTGISSDCKVITGTAKAFEYAWRNMHPYGMLWLYFVRREIMEGLSYREEMRVKGDGVLVGEMFTKVKKICQARHEGYFYRQTPVSIFRSERKAIDSIRYMNANRAVWHKHLPFVQSLGYGAQMAMSREMQGSLESDLLDWVCGRKGVTSDESGAVKRAYDDARLCLMPGDVCLRPLGVRLAIALYNRTGVEFGLILVRIVRYLRGEMKRLVTR